MEGKRVYCAYDVAEFLGINLPGAYEVMRSESFPAFYIGKKILVSKTAFDRWLDSEAAGCVIKSYKQKRAAK